MEAETRRTVRGWNRLFSIPLPRPKRPSRSSCEIVERKFEGNTKLNESVRGWIQLSVIKLNESLLEKLNFLKLSPPPALQNVRLVKNSMFVSTGYPILSFLFSLYLQFSLIFNGKRFFANGKIFKNERNGFPSILIFLIRILLLAGKTVLTRLKIVSIFQSIWT